MANMLEKASYSDGDFISLARQFEMYDVVDDVDLILRYDPQGAVERDRDVADIKRRLGEALHKVRKELDRRELLEGTGMEIRAPTLRPTTKLNGGNKVGSEVSVESRRGRAR